MAYELFLSHYDDDGNLVESLENLLCHSIVGLSRQRVFRSSDRTRASPQGTFDDQIIEALAQSKLVIGILTPIGSTRPWVVAECGAAVFSGKLFLAIAKGLAPHQVPSCFSRKQCYDLRAPDSINAFAQAVAKALKLEFAVSQRHSELVDVVRKAAHGRFSSWHNVKGTFITPSSKDNAFDLAGIFKIAEHSVVISGQNLFGLFNDRERGPERLELIREFLSSESQGRTVEILMQNPRCDEAVFAWGGVTDPSDEQRAKYAQDLKDAEDTAIKFIAECVDQKIGRLSVTLIEFPSLNAMFADPESDEGWLVIRPVVNRSQIGSERPQFVVRCKEHREIVEHYWKNVRDVLRRQSSGSIRYSTFPADRWL